MSRGNVERAYQATDAFNRRDLDALLALIDPEVEFTPFEVAIEGGEPFRGHDGIRTWCDETFAVFPDLTMRIDEVRDLVDVALVHGRLVGEGAGSGAQFERALWMAQLWRDGQVAWWSARETEAEALEAVGLAE